MSDESCRVIGFTILEETDGTGVKYIHEEHPDVEFTRVISEWFSLVFKDGKYATRFAIVMPDIKTIGDLPAHE